MKKLTEVNNFYCLRIEMKRTGGKKDSEETCIYRKILEIMVVHISSIRN